MEWKRTIACSVIAIAILIAGFVAGSPDYNGNCRNSQPAKQTLVTSSTQPPKTAADEADESDCHSPHWYTTFKRPDGMLVVVGIITFIIIGWQSWETRRAVETSNKGVLLQEASMQQWVLLKNWAVRYRPGEKPSVDIQFEIFNPTNWPLKMFATKIRIKSRESWRLHNVLLPPTVPCLVRLEDIPIDESEQETYLANGTIGFIIFGMAVFRDCRKEPQEQDISGSLTFNKAGANFTMEWLPSNPFTTQKEESKSQKPN